MRAARPKSSPRRLLLQDVWIYAAVAANPGSIVMALQRTADSSALFVLLLVTATACNRSSAEQGAAAQPAATSDGGVAAAAPAGSTPRQPPAPAPELRLPSGPRLAIVPGGGVGPIRIGATKQTIERHMEAPCEESTETLCRYVDRGLEFHLKDGVVHRVHVHRFERPAGGQTDAGALRTYGPFNGAIPPDLRLGMVPWAIQEHLGPPKKIEPVADGGAFGTKELHFYDGMVLEYDLYRTGKLILGGVRIPE